METFVALLAEQNLDAGDFRRHHAHYALTVMKSSR